MGRSASSPDSSAIPDDRLSVERRGDDVLVVRVRSADTGHERLPDAVFSFRCGDPQYSYWLDRMNHRPDGGDHRLDGGGHRLDGGDHRTDG